MRLRSLVFAIVAASLGAVAHAQAWPDKPIKFVVAAGPGSSLDTLARVIGDKLREKLGQPVIVENKPGAQSIIAAEYVAKQPADGYTIFMGPSGPMTINPATYSKLPYDPQRDFTPISMICSFPLIVVVDAKLPVKSVRELIAYAKANPGKLNYASGGVGSAQHLAAELFGLMAGINIVHVPFKGAVSIPDVIAGRDPPRRLDRIRGTRIDGARDFMVPPWSAWRRGACLQAVRRERRGARARHRAHGRGWRGGPGNRHSYRAGQDAGQRLAPRGFLLVDRR